MAGLQSLLQDDIFALRVPMRYYFSDISLGNLKQKKSKPVVLQVGVVNLLDYCPDSSFEIYVHLPKHYFSRGRSRYA